MQFSTGAVPSCQQGTGVQLSHALSTTFCVWLFDYSHPVGVRWHLIVDLTCVCLMIGNAERLFMHMLAICMFSLEKYLFGSSAPFFFFFNVSFKCTAFLFIAAFTAE